MSRRRWELTLALFAVAVALLTAGTVPVDDLGPWAAGVFGPLVASGAMVCVLSWPPRFDHPEDQPEVRRTRWRWVYVIPLVVTGVLTPRLVATPLTGFSPTFTVGLVLFLAYLALLLGAAVFLVVLLPIGQLLRAVGSVVQGERISGYGPSAAALILSITIFSFAGAFAVDGIPDDELGVFEMIAKVAGVPVPGLTVTSAGWLLAARLAAIGVIASAVGMYLAGRRQSRPDDPR